MISREQDARRASRSVCCEWLCAKPSSRVTYATVRWPLGSVDARCPSGGAGPPSRVVIARIWVLSGTVGCDSRGRDRNWEGPSAPTSSV